MQFMQNNKSPDLFFKLQLKDAECGSGLAGHAPLPPSGQKKNQVGKAPTPALGGWRAHSSAGGGKVKKEIKRYQDREWKRDGPIFACSSVR